MKILIPSILLTLLSTAVFAQDAETKKLYKWTDEQGIVHYSDEPKQDAEIVQIKQVPTTVMEKTKPNKYHQAPQAKGKTTAVYDSLSFVSPEDGGVIRNNASSITLSASVKPELQSGHKISFFLDGKLLPNESNALSVTAQSIDYGPHSANFIIVDSSGGQMKSSPTIRFQYNHQLGAQRNKKNQK